MINRKVTHIKSKAAAIKAALASLDKKAANPLILELKGITAIADYFVICSGGSGAQVRAIVDHIDEVLGKSGARPLRVEGAGHSRWVLMDYGDIIVHVFDEETRAYYELEKFWLDAPRIPLEDSGKEADKDEDPDNLGREDKRAASERRD